MNKENVLAVADAIEKHSIPDLGFNMGFWNEDLRTPDADLSGHKCNTVACIGGWAEAVFPGAEADQSLGLNHAESGALFYPFGHFSDTPSQAVAVLRHLAETGEVDWSVAEGH